MFLNTIVADKLQEIEQRQKTMPLAELTAVIKQEPPPINLASALSQGDLSLIAEIKRASPSAGILAHSLDPVELAHTYARCGATAISILTDFRYFGGSLQDLGAVRRGLPSMPLLRKDFILEPYQLFESRAWGADAVLLIVALLDDARLEELLSLSHHLGMQCLVEVHDEHQLEKALTSQARIIGINNRNLDTMTVDLSVTERLRPLIPPDRIVVIESGIKSRQDVLKLRALKVNAMLVGEALVTATQVETRIRELL